MKKILFVATLLLLTTEIISAQTDAQKFEKVLAMKQINGAVVQSSQVEFTNQQITVQQLEYLRTEIAEKDEIALIQSFDNKILVFIHTDGVNVDVFKELILHVTENDFIIKEPHDMSQDEILQLMQSL